MTASAAQVDPDRRILERSPLVNVVWQIRFTGVPDVADGRIALALQDKLANPTTLSKVAAPQFSLQMSSSGSPGPETSIPQPTGEGWRLSSADGATHVSLQSDSLSVETADYNGWTDQFSGWIYSALEALALVAEPQVLLRVGMRYINAVFGSALDRDPFSNVTELTDIVSPALLGFLSDKALAPSVEGVQARQILRAGRAMSHIQHATIRSDSGELGLLLDIDSYVEESKAFELADVRSTSDLIHLSGLDIFQKCLTPAAWQALGPRSERAE